MTFSPKLKAGLVPVQRRTAQWVDALAKVSPQCRCGTAFAAEQGVCPFAPDRCRRVTLTAIRVAMNLLRLPHAHISDVDLPGAVRDLASVFVGLQDANDYAAFSQQIATALRAPQTRVGQQ